MKTKLVLPFFLINIALLVGLSACKQGISQDSKTTFLNKAFKKIEQSSPSDLTIIRNGIKKEIATILCNKYDMECIGFSGGWCGSKILGLSFEIYRVIDKATARLILVDSVKEFVAKVNSNDPLTPYLESLIFIKDSSGNTVYLRNYHR